MAITYKGYEIFKTDGETFPKLKHHICFASDSIENLKERIDNYGTFSDINTCSFYVCDKENYVLRNHKYFGKTDYKYFAVKIDCDFTQGVKLNDYTIVYRGINYDEYKRIVSGKQYISILINSLYCADNILNKRGLNTDKICEELEKKNYNFFANITDIEFSVGYLDDDDIIYYKGPHRPSIDIVNENKDFNYLVIYYPNGIDQKNTKHVGTKTLTNRGDNMDLTQLITMKMMNKLFDGDGDLDIGKMYLLQSLQNNGTIQIDDVLKSKLISKFGLDKDTEDLSVEKLMLLKMLQSGEFDITQLITMKMMDKLLDDDKKTK